MSVLLLAPPAVKVVLGFNQVVPVDDAVNTVPAVPIPRVALVGKVNTLFVVIIH